MRSTSFFSLLFLVGCGNYKKFETTKLAHFQETGETRIENGKLVSEGNGGRLAREIFFYSVRDISEELKKKIAEREEPNSSNNTRAIALSPKKFTNDFYQAYNDEQSFVLVANDPKQKLSEQEKRNLRPFEGVLGRLDYGPQLWYDDERYLPSRPKNAKQVGKNKNRNKIKRQKFVEGRARTPGYKTYKKLPVREEVELLAIGSRNNKFENLFKKPVNKVSHIHSSLKDTEDRTLTLFVHGFNVSPTAALERALILDRDFNFESNPETGEWIYQEAPKRLTLAYLWPSTSQSPLFMLNNVASYIPWYLSELVSCTQSPFTLPAFTLTGKNVHSHYLGDLTQVDFAAVHLAELLIEFAQLENKKEDDKQVLENLDVVAHSMGTQVLTKALYIVSQRSEKISSLRNIVLVGGDISLHKLGLTLPAVKVHNNGHVMVILNRKDKVVNVSTSFQGGLPRLSTTNYLQAAEVLTRELNNRGNSDLAKRLVIFDVTDVASRSPFKVLTNHYPLDYPKVELAVRDFLDNSSSWTNPKELLPSRSPNLKLVHKEIELKKDDGRKNWETPTVYLLEK